MTTLFSYSGFSSAAIHAGRSPDPSYAHIMPIYANSTYVFDTAEQGMRRFSGEEKGYIYGRWGNPTITEAEERIAALEGFGLVDETGALLQLKAILHASGMAAISNTLFTFARPGDRIVSIEAFEHFGFERYDDFFKNCYEILPADGRMAIQSSVSYHPMDMAARGKKLTLEMARFIKFMATDIFPGGRLPTTQMMVDHGEKAGFEVPDVMSLRNHYIKTLGIWAAALEHNKDKAIAISGEVNYDRYMRYLTGCQYYFLDECLDVSLVTYAKSQAAA